MWCPSFLVRTGCSVDQNIKENRLGLDDCQSAFARSLVHRGLSSWGILSRPCGTDLGGNVHPGLTSWSTLSQSCPNWFFAVVLPIHQRKHCMEAQTHFVIPTGAKRSGGMAKWKVVAHHGICGGGWTESAQQQPTQFRLPACSSTHSARYAFQKGVFPLIWTAVVFSLPFLRAL